MTQVLALAVFLVLEVFSLIALAAITRLDGWM